MPKCRWPAVTLTLLFVGAPALADDIRPLSDARPMADEKCIEQCDTQSDQCMQAADGDSGKMQVCDDKYSECLQACEAR
ncbi:MAG: hypothetical protein WD944_09650 [Steroidobacteraceae bacterium]